MKKLVKCKETIYHSDNTEAYTKNVLYELKLEKNINNDIEMIVFTNSNHRFVLGIKGINEDRLKRIFYTKQELRKEIIDKLLNKN